MGMEIGQTERMRGLRVDTVCFGMTESVGLFLEPRGENRIEVSAVIGGVGVLGVEEGELPCKTGDVFVSCPDVPHFFRSVDSTVPLKVRRIAFDPEEWLAGEPADNGSCRFCYGVFSDGSRMAYTMLTSEAQRTVYSFFDSIEEETRVQKEDWQDAVKAQLSLLLIAVARYIKSAIKKTPALTQKEWSLVSLALREAEQNFSDSELTLETIADRAFVSRSQLSRSFKHVMGESFSERLRRIRLSRACELLRDSRLTVEAIMQECGLRDMPTFYRNFSSFSGMTPHQYRTAFARERDDGGEDEGGAGILQEISESLQKGRAKAVRELVERAVREGCTPEDILERGLLCGMSAIGEKFKSNEVYVPEVLVAARAINEGMKILKPYLAQAGVKAKGRVCLGTVRGDLHDIGKNLVKMMMEGRGIEVIDLGTDVSPDTFVKAAIEKDCRIICCSALLTTTTPVIGEVVRKAEESGIRHCVKILVGGAPVSAEICKMLGADLYAPDAASAAEAALAILAEDETR